MVKLENNVLSTYAKFNTVEVDSTSAFAFQSGYLFAQLLTLPYIHNKIAKATTLKA